MISRSASLIFLLCTAATAGDWQPNPNIQYTLTIKHEANSSPTVGEDRWIESLLANLRKGGANPKVTYRFTKSTATFAINGSIQQDTVCVSRDDPDIYFIVNENYARFIINFKTGDVGANGYAGGIFVSPSKSFCVLVLDQKGWPPSGIPIASAPDNHATFEGRSVSWH